MTGQMYYSLLARDIELEYLPMALGADIGTMVWSPLSSGFLSGKSTRETPNGGGGLNPMDLLPCDREQGYPIIDSLTKIAEAREVPIGPARSLPSELPNPLQQRPAGASVRHG
jgi:aryl-alcohol dehydrogenase-like predicted oxidoreductase